MTKVCRHVTGYVSIGGTSGKGWFDDKDAEYYESKEKVWGSFGISYPAEPCRLRSKGVTRLKLVWVESSRVANSAGHDCDRSWARRSRRIARLNTLAWVHGPQNRLHSLHFVALAIFFLTKASSFRHTASYESSFH
jgi:hypothetical protein